MGPARRFPNKFQATHSRLSFEEMKMKQGWKIGQTTNGVELVEVVANADEVASYEFAKQSALQMLNEQLNLCQRQIQRIESNEYLKIGRMPRFKAWLMKGHQLMVVAESKEGAMDVTGLTRRVFNEAWTQCEGTWWYGLAKSRGFVTLEDVASMNSNWSDVKTFEQLENALLQVVMQ
jgi:hypothetical protein